MVYRCRSYIFMVMKYVVVLEVHTDDTVDVTKRKTKRDLENEVIMRYASGNLFTRIKGVNKVNVSVKANGVV